MHLLNLLAILVAVAPAILALPAQLQEREAPNGRPSVSIPVMNGPWSHARISQRQKFTPEEMVLSDRVTDYYSPGWGIPKRFTTQDWKFSRDPDWGEFVIVYVVDTGVLDTHAEFSDGNVADGYVVPGIQDGKKATDDVCDHGTGVASLIAGKLLGIAPKALIVPVRIYDKHGCEEHGQLGDIIAGIDWALDDYRDRLTREPRLRGAVINLSSTVFQFQSADQFGKSASEEAFAKVISAGVHLVVAAGNDNADICFMDNMHTKSLVKPVGQIIVGGTDPLDRRWNSTMFSSTKKGGATLDRASICLHQLTP